MLNSSITHFRKIVFTYLLSLNLITPFAQANSIYNKYDNGFPEEKYHAILDQFLITYGNIIQSKGGELEIIRDWSDGAVNMWAEKWGTRYILEIPGGMVRYYLINEEAFILSICHELGHLLGGPPQSGEISLEGQSDYFASSRCINKMLQQISPLKRLNYDTDVIDVCTKERIDSHSLCLRAMQGAKSLTSYYAEIIQAPFPSLSTPSQSVVPKTLTTHPHPQCRLDTFKNGYLGKPRPTCWFAQ